MHIVIMDERDLLGGGHVEVARLPHLEAERVRSHFIMYVYMVECIEARSKVGRYVRNEMIGVSGHDSVTLVRLYCVWDNLG